ncbi:MAG: hypothetical protein MHPSP_003946, partial [Paramarteilia canceri]
TWLKVITRIMVKKTNQSMSWLTPLNFLATQPYFSRLKSNPTGPKDFPDVVKNVNAFPPNFIHALDAAHMLMTASECYKNNIEFVAIHDCFWTHACSVPKMSIILREKFVDLHSSPILQNLLDDFSSILPETHRGLLPKVPRRGFLELKHVKNSEFFFC